MIENVFMYVYNTLLMADCQWENETIALLMLVKNTIWKNHMN
jgi:hypothetical protein